jgi:hypothetical protein
MTIKAAQAIECSNVSDPKVKNMMENLSQITVDEKFLGSCAVNDEIAKQASWKDNVDKKIKRIQRLDYEKLDDAFSDVLLNGQSPSKFIESGVTSNNQEKYFQFKISHNYHVKNRVNDEKFLLRKKISEKAEALKKMAVNKSCVYDAEFKLVPQNGIQTSNNQILSKEEALIDLQSKIKEVEKNEGVTVCSTPTYNYSGLTQVNNKVEIEIGDDVFFADNQWTLSDTKSAKLKKMIDEKLKSNRPNCERKIRTVQIATSSSLLRNQITDPLGNEIPQDSWDFQKLSRLRAEEIGTKIKDSYGLEDNQIPKPNFLGENGNGTSGPCPYKLVKNPNGTYKVIRNSIDEKELKKHRYGKINIEFEEVGDGCLKVEAPKETPNHYHYRSKCYAVKLHCINPPR